MSVALEDAVAAIVALPPGAKMADVMPLINALAEADLGNDLLAIELARARVQERLRDLKIPNPRRLAAIALKVEPDEPEKPEKAGGGSPLVLEDVEPWPEPVDGARLLDEISATVKRYVVAAPSAYVAVALWVVSTYVLDATDIAPVLGLTSPEKRCGKTTTLDLCSALARRPISAANISPAAVFRVIEKHHPTLLIDEADTFLRENQELRGVLNAGNRRGGQVIRTVGEDHDPKAFDVFGFKLIACIGELPDTLHDRAIEVRLERRLPSEKVQRFRLARVNRECEPLRRKAMRWATDRVTELMANDPSVPDALHDRAADNWRPLLTIADLAGEDWPARGRAAALALAKVHGAEADSVGTLLLADLRAIFGGADLRASEAIVKALVAMEDRPWPELTKGKPLTAPALAKLLRPFKVKPATRRDGDATFKGYVRSDLEPAWRRYLPAETPARPVTTSQPNNGAGFSGNTGRHTGDVVTGSESEKRSAGAGCDDVTVENDNHGPESADDEFATPIRGLRS